jgi:Rrf2 family protein
MLFTKASEYALMAVVAIAKSEGPRDVLSLSQDLALSRSFLAKVLQSLAKADLLISYKGAGGGFVLARAPEEIAVLSLVRAIDGSSGTVLECAAAVCNCPSGEEKGTACTIWPFINRLQGRIDHLLAETTIADLIND